MIADDIAGLAGPILVLGAGGFIGANLFRTLRAERADVVAAVHHGPGWRLADVADVRRVDVTVAASVRALLDEVAPRTVLDATAFGGYPFQRDPERIYAVNFTGVVNVVEELARGDLAAYVHAGSSSEYGTNAAGPDEDAPLRPNSHYAVSKAAAAEYLGFAGRSRGLPVVNLRLYSVYGPWEEPTRLVPTVLRAAVDSTPAQLSSPDPVRDFVHVDDVCRAFVLAAARMRPELAGESLNIGTGVQTSVDELVALAAVDHPGLEPVYGTNEARGWEVPRWYADPSRARELIGWSPSIGLADGLRVTGRWLAQQGTTAAGAEPVDATPAIPAISAKPSVSAVVACYNEGPAVPVMIERLTATFTRIGCDYEIIIVNNGSTDGTAERLVELSATDPHLIGINHSRSFGSQMAFYSGMELAAKDTVVILDGDLQDPPELIEEFYERMLQGYDVVYGHRVRRDMPRLTEAAYRGFYRLFRATSDIDIPRDAGDFSLITRPVVEWMLASPERDLFVRGMRAYVGFRQIGVDYVRPDRLFGHSTNNLGKNIGWAKKAIFAYSRKPLDLLTNLGFVSLAVSLLVIVAQVVARLIIPSASPRGFTTTFLSIWLLGSLILLGIGVLGEYLGKVLEEVKARPRWIRESIITGGRVHPGDLPAAREQGATRRDSGAQD